MAMLAARFDEALEFGEPALALAESLDLPDVRLNVLTTVGGVRANRGNEAGLAELAESAALGERVNSPELPRALNNLGSVLGVYGRVRQSDETMAAAIVAAERFGARQMVLFSRANYLFHDYRAGRWDKLVADAEVAIGEAVAAGLSSAERMALITLTLVQLGAGRCRTRGGRQHPDA